jgi:hypothetical protein
MSILLTLAKKDEPLWFAGMSLGGKNNDAQLKKLATQKEGRKG